MTRANELPDDGSRLSSSRTTVVVITYNRADQLLRNLSTLRALNPGVPIVVVDNASTDGTAPRVRAAHPDVDVVRLTHNEGAAGRTAGVQRARTPCVAFADDDSWWASGSLDTAADLLDQNPELGLLATRLLVEPDGALDETCEAMAASPLPMVPGVGPQILGFIACGCVVRQDAYLAVGGFHPRFGVGGEETLLAIDLVRAGWLCAYTEDVVAHHEPKHGEPRPRRAEVLVRNALWTSWLRRPLPRSLRVTASATRRAVRDRATRDGLWEAVRGLPWVLGERRVVDADLERQLVLLDAPATRPVRPTHGRTGLGNHRGMPLVRKESRSAVDVGEQSPGGGRS
jgi:N-acetylglucosaminyl-diphospho-decaprenol L-rhamnosyltransferase